MAHDPHRHDHHPPGPGEGQPASQILSALRGVLKTCWRLGLVDAETYARAADVANIWANTLPSARAIERHEVRALLAECDDSPAGRRDAVMLAILYRGGLKRAEAIA